jgi:GWxTD domain-containing protein
MNDRKVVTGTAFLLIAAALVTASCGISLAPSRDSWYTAHYMIMQDFEKSLYTKLGPEGKTEFRRLFWAFREPGSRLEFGARLRFATTAFKRENSRQPWNTDRGRVYLLNGNPVAIDYQDNDNWADPTSAGDRSREDIGTRLGETWTYQHDKSLIYYSFQFRRPNEWRLSDRMTGNQYRGGLETRNRDLVFGIKDLDAYKAELAKLK